MADEHRVVILGGGFGGLNAARGLKHTPAHVTLIDRRNYHLFQPLLYQVATGSLSPGEIAAPIRGILSSHENTDVLLADAVDIDPPARNIVLRDGAVIHYDTLIVSTGSEASYFGHNEWSEIAPPLKSIEDATAIRHKILIAFEEAERTCDPNERRAWLTFVIVGGGATGVELAGALGEIAHHTLRHDFRSIKPSDATIYIVDGGPRILTSFVEKLSVKAEKELQDLGVTVRTGLFVDSLDGRGVTVKNKTGEHQRIRANTILWAAGVAISSFGKQLAARTHAETEKGGHIKVDGHLNIPNYPEIFVIGDLAYYLDKKGKPLPGVAQVAMQGGSYAAKVIHKRLTGDPDIRDFEYFDKGQLAVIGRGAAVAEVFGAKLSGLIAWLVWAFIHILYIVEFQSRLLVMVEWGFLYVTYNRGARLITGSTALESVSHPHVEAKSQA